MRRARAILGAIPAKVAKAERRAMRALERHYDEAEGEGWAVRLQGLTELLPVSRRQVAAVREALAG